MADKVKKLPLLGTSTAVKAGVSGKKRVPRCKCNTGKIFPEFEYTACGYLIDETLQILDCPVCGFGFFGFFKGNLAYNLKHNLKEL